MPSSPRPRPHRHGGGGDGHPCRFRLFADYSAHPDGELEVSADADSTDQPVTTVLAGPRHGDYAAFQPGTASAMGYDDLKVIEAARFFSSIVDGAGPGATIDDAVASALALEAIARSASSRQWTPIDA